MKDLILLHIGDIHFRDVIFIDESSNLSGTILPDNLIDQSIWSREKNRSEIIIESLMQEIQNSTVSIMMSGDLGNDGIIDHYIDCLNFLKERINKSFFDKCSPQKLFLVPGNHDIDRTKVEENSFLPKFEPIIEALSNNNYPDIPCDGIRVNKIYEESSSKVLLISVNSCIGCGESQYFPKEIREHLEPLLKDYDVMDTPLIHTDHIEQIVTCIKENKEFLPLILVHHNLLPLKRNNKPTMYTDLINSGILREKLLKLNKPILYVHGHIHDDPIEIIQSPDYENSKIICISAPLLLPLANKKMRGSPKYGFNKIKIIAGNISPIGCEVITHRLNNSEIKIERKKIRFFNPAHKQIQINDTDKLILSLIGSKEMFFAQLKQKTENGDHNIDSESILSSLERLSWLGYIEYDDEDESIQTRRMKRLVAHD